MLALAGLKCSFKSKRYHKKGCMTMLEINEKLADAKFRMEHYQRLCEERNELVLKLDEAHRVYEMLCDQLEKEDRDVAKLNSLSMANLFATLTQRKEERLEKEEEEALAALRAVKKQENEISVLQFQLDALNQKLRELEKAKAEYNELLNLKKSLIDDPAIHSMERELEDITLRQREINEAMDAGDLVLSRLKDAREKLSSAAGWGIYDMVGGGMIATAIKHERISEAQASLQSLESDIRHFNKELNDVKLASASDLEMDSFSVIGDYLFDNLFMDWHVQNQVSRMQDVVDTSIDEVDALLQQLYRQQLANQQAADALKGKIEERLASL